jgi:MFS family permease
MAVDYYRHLKLISRNSWLFLAGLFFVSMMFAVNSLILNLYLREMDFSEGFIGRVLSAGAIGSMVSAVPWALLIARYQIKSMLIVTTILSAASCVVMVTVASEWAILGASFLVGAFISLSRVASAPFIMRNSGETERTHVFSLNFSNWMFAGIIGSYLGGYAQKWYAASIGEGPASYRFVLYAGVVCCVFAIVPFALIRAKAPPKEGSQLALNKQLLKERGSLLFRLSFPFLLVGLGAGLIIPFLNLYFRDVFGMSTERIGVYYALVQVTMIVGTLAGPILSKRFGMVRTLVFTELASIPFMLIMAFSNNVPLVVMSFLWRGALMNMGQPIGTNFTMEMVPENVHALANSVSMIAWTSAWAASTHFGGIIIERHGYEPSFLIAVGLYVASSVVYYYYFSKSERKIDGVYRIIGTAHH